MMVMALSPEGVEGSTFFERVAADNAHRLKSF
jgi:hypothetical protein